MFRNISDIENKLDELSCNNQEYSLKLLHKIIEDIPDPFSSLIKHSYKYKRVPKEFMLSSILFTISSAIGSTFYTHELGYTNYSNMYFTLIGSRGDTKSEAIKIATKPLIKIDDINYEKYNDELKQQAPDYNDEPIRKQVLIQNASIESAHKAHNENQNGIGILTDEIYWLIDKMSNSSSRDGVAWRTLLLEGYNNGFIDVLRKTTKSFRIKKSYITLIGGLQHQFLPKLFGNGNLESGLIDRFLFTPKLTHNTKLSKEQIPEECLTNYNNCITNILDYKLQSEDTEEKIKNFQIPLVEEARDELFSYCQSLINKQQTAEPMIKEYISKMQISIHKFTLIAHLINSSKTSNYISKVSLKSIETAILLNEFYFNNFKVLLKNFNKNQSKSITIKDIIGYAKSNNLLQKDVVSFTNVNKGTVSKIWNKEKKPISTGNH